MDGSEMLDIKDAAKFLDCHPVTLNRMAQKGKIRAFKRLNKWYFKKEDLTAQYRQNTVDF